MTCWAIPNTLLSSETFSSRGDSAAVDLGLVRAEHAMQVTVDYPAGAAFGVSLVGSLNGEQWYGLGVDHSQGTAAADAGTATVLVVNATKKPARFVRASVFVYAQSVTVTATATSS